MKFLTYAVLALSLSGCVTRQTYREAEVAWQSCQGQLEQCRQQRQGCETQRQSCEQARAMMSDQLDQCMTLSVDAQTRVQNLAQRAEQLRSTLQAEILAKNVEIEQLRDRLSVRVLDRILFNTGSAQILPAGQAVLDKVAAALRSGDELIRVEGHTDRVPIGPALQAKYPSNWELSTARASSVVRYFQDRQQIDPLRMEAVGFSMYRPVTQGDSAEALQRNRRVEIVLRSAQK
jgi:chemotaxis protein MotB